MTKGPALPYDSLAQLRGKLVKAVPLLKGVDDVPENAWTVEPAGSISDSAFAAVIADHYLTNPVARASALMAELSANAHARSETAVAAE